MRTEESLALKKTLVDRELRRLLSREDTLLYQAMRYAVLSGGKRFRPLLLLASGRCFGVRRQALLPFACALELIHNYSLIHDDLPSMDNDDFRRGKPACHRAYGEDVALLAGDGLLTLAFEITAAAPVSAELLSQKQEATMAFSRRAGVSGMIGGQVLDITLKPADLTEEIVQELILKKTGALIVAAVEVGALLGRARPQEKRSVMRYAKNVGLAFQIRDDIIDSRTKRRGGGPPRPDYVNFFGLDRARKKLEELVRDAVASLEGFSSRAAELRYLASSLRSLRPEARHG
jgi:geranylgeranyl diphosphate synthase type II